MTQMQSHVSALRGSADETQAMVKNLTDALLKPQPGHKDSLLDRVAAVTIKVERGEWSIRVLAVLASILPAGVVAWIWGMGR